MRAFVPDQKRQELQVGWAHVLTRTGEKPGAASPRWEYLVVHAAGDGDQTVPVVISVDGDAGVDSVCPGSMLPGVLRALGLERWELVTVVPSLTGLPASMYVFKRPLAQGAPAHLDLVEEGRDDDV